MAEDEVHLEAFFRSGDEGTYAGGPSSLPPVYSELEDRDTEPALEAAIAQRLERRARYQQLVTRLMSVLGVAALLAVTVRAAALRGGDGAAPAARPAAERLALAAPPEPAPLAPVAAIAPETPPPEALVEAPPAPVPPRADRDDRPRAPAKAARRAPTPPVPVAPERSVPRASASFPSAPRSASHAPPTANFANFPD